MSSILNIISDRDDQDLNLTKIKLGSNAHAAHDASAVNVILNDLANQGVAFDVLNFIGHSTANHFLEIGTYNQGGWVIDEDAPGIFRTNFAAALRRLNVTQIRLLGCSTATTDAAWSVVNSIADSLVDENLGMKISATRRLISTSDYDSFDFVGVDSLVTTGRTPTGHQIGYISSKAPPPINVGPSKTPILMAKLFAALRTESKDDLPPTLWPRLFVDSMHTGAIVSQIDKTKTWSLPGLQTLPQVELLLSLESGGVNRMQVLLDNSFVRVFPTNESEVFGLICQVAHPKILSAFVSRCI